MADLITLIFAFAIGMALGVFFFGGLWWTVLKGIHTTRPGLLFSLSFIVRTGVTLAGFIFVSQGDFGRLAGCLLGFFIARWGVIRYTKPILEKESPAIKEDNHET